jgi:hypothetical protein
VSDFALRPVPQLKRSDLAKLTPEQIVAAREAGMCAEMMGAEAPHELATGDQAERDELDALRLTVDAVTEALRDSP